METKVKVEYAKTVNTGNYENIRLSASIELPCHKSNVTQAFEDAWNKCKNEVEQQEKEIVK